jgi:hypothetical protein
MTHTLASLARSRPTVVAAATAAAALIAIPPAHAQDADESDAAGTTELQLFDLLPAEDVPAALLAADDDEIVHVVGRGESLADIALAYGIEGIDGWRRLFDANPDIEDPNLIEPGHELRVPHPDEDVERRDLPAVAATPAPSGGSGSARGVTTAGSGVWDRLARCEAGGNWSANTGNGFYGGLQFHPQTWSAHGGQAYAPSAHQASRAQQIAVAERVLASQGWGAWPSCSRQLGLR